MHTDNNPVLSVVSHENNWGVFVGSQLIDPKWDKQEQAQDWVEINYPGFVKTTLITAGPFGPWTPVTQYRYKTSTVVFDEIDGTITHPIVGTVFRQMRFFNGNNKTTDVKYINMDEDTGYLKSIAGGIRGGDNPEFHYALVRRGNREGWVYYPLPLIFKSRYQRILSSKELGFRIPMERWIRRRRLEVLELLRRHEFITQDEFNHYR